MFDLPKSVRLKDLALRVISERVGWIAMELRTITPGHRELRKIAIRVHLATGSTDPDLRHTIQEEILGQWSELDHVLAQLWESHSIRSKIICFSPPTSTENNAKECVGWLLPTVTRRGILAPVEWGGYEW